MNARSLFTRLFSRAPASETPGGVLRRSGAGITSTEFAATHWMQAVIENNGDAGFVYMEAV